MANAGKEFEKQFKESCPKDVYFLRLKDSATGFSGGNTNFTVKSEYDCQLYKDGVLYALELKSKGSKRLAYKTNGKGTLDIKQHQINNLNKASAFGIKAGFIFNFRTVNETFFVPIQVFNTITNFGMSEKCSISIEDVKRYIGEGVVLIPQRLKKVNYAYDLSVLFN